MSAMKFCRECNNILYPKEEKGRRVLLFACRNCEHQSQQNVIIEELKASKLEEAPVLADPVATYVQPLRRRVQPEEVADNNCVYRHEVQHAAAERTQVLQDVASDPTLPRTKEARCAACGHGEAVFFQATARGEEGMTLFFVCCNLSCGNRWRE